MGPLVPGLGLLSLALNSSQRLTPAARKAAAAFVSRTTQVRTGRAADRVLAPDGNIRSTLLNKRQVLRHPGHTIRGHEITRRAGPVALLSLVLLGL